MPRNRLRSFVFAFKGFIWMARTQWNFKFHLAATLMTIIAGVYFDIKAWEWVSIVISIGLVWMAEALNTSIEFLLDKIHPEHDMLIGKAKDLAATSVLIGAMVALLTGLIVFVPYFTALWKQLQGL